MARLDSIDEFRIFDAIARTGSLSGASRDLSLSLAVISKRLKRIEETLGVQLIQRSTRSMFLTAEGLNFHEHCQTVLEAVSGAMEIQGGKTAQGVVRVTSTAAFAQRQIAPRLKRFLDANPGVEVQILPSDKAVDLIEHKIDVAFRHTPYDSGRLITRTIAADGSLLCASPDYLREHGTPQHPDDLIHHRALTVGDPPLRHWSLHRGAERIEAPIRSAVSSLDGEAPHALALVGGGIAMKASWDVIDDVRSGRLVRVLPEWWGDPCSLRIAFPQHKRQPFRVRALIDFMQNELRKTVRDNADLGLFPLSGNG